jgi:MoaA/NifB/PqqE/SkfB family radical SAM enzyme
MVSSPYIKVIEILARLRKVRIFPSALVTITSHGIDKIDQIVDAYIQNGFTSLFLRPLNPYGYAYGNPAFSYTADAFFDSYKCALEYIINKAKDGVAIREEFFSILLRKVLTPFNDGFVDLQNPSAIGSMCMIVDQHGDIYPSDEARMIAAMSDDRWKVGSIRDNDCGIKMRDARKDILRTGILELWPECTFCVYNAYCSADPVKIYYKAAYTHDRYCTTNKKMFDLLFSYILDADVRMQAVLRKWANAQ